MDQQSSSPPPGIVALYCRSFHLLNHTFLSSHFLLHLMVTIIKETSIFIANIITLLSTGLSDQHLNQKYQSWASRSSSTSRWFSFSIQFSIFNSRWIIISIRMILTDQNSTSRWFSPIRIFSVRMILTDQNSTSKWFSPIIIFFDQKDSHRSEFNFKMILTDQNWTLSHTSASSMNAFAWLRSSDSLNWIK